MLGLDEPLSDQWTVWADQSIKNVTPEQFAASLEVRFSFHTMGQFATGWQQLVCSGDWKQGTNVRVFRKGLSPMWEAPENVDGGKWMLAFDGMGPGPELEHMFAKVLHGMCGNAFASSGHIV